MGPKEVMVEGALAADGSLVLDERPSLPPGRVQVILRAVEPATGTGGGLEEVLRGIWAAQEARGFRGRPWREIIADLDAMRDEWDGPRAQAASPKPPAEEPPSTRGETERPG